MCNDLLTDCFIFKTGGGGGGGGGGFNLSNQDVIPYKWSGVAFSR